MGKALKINWLFYENDSSCIKVIKSIGCPWEAKHMQESIIRAHVSELIGNKCEHNQCEANFCLNEVAQGTFWFMGWGMMCRRCVIW